MRRVASELSIEWPPSMPIIEAMRPRRKLRSTSSAVNASSKTSGQRFVIRCTTSICSSVAVTAVGSRHRRGHVDRPELAADAAGLEPRDVGHQRRCALGDVGLAEVAPRVDLAQRPRVVVVAVDERYLRVQGLGAGNQFRLGGKGRLGHGHGERHGARAGEEGAHGRNCNGVRPHSGLRPEQRATLSTRVYSRSSVSRSTFDWIRLACSCWPLLSVTW